MIRFHNLQNGDYDKHCLWFLHQCNSRIFSANFVSGDKTGFALNGAVNNHNVRMYAPANQPPDFHFNVSDSWQKFTVWVGLCGNADMLRPCFFNGNINGKSYLNKVLLLMTVLFEN